MRKLPKRILSIDVLRSITMLLMIFVNDVAGVREIPKWIEHTAADTDGMGFSDLIFPAFLFIVGLSLPFAIQRRWTNGDTFLGILGYIALRAFALIIMGFFHVNLENYNSDAALLSKNVYTIILTAGFFLVWLDYPEKRTDSSKYWLIRAGILIIALMAYLYKGRDLAGMTPSWWGILGIIGWAYFFAATVYLLSKGKLIGLLIAFLVFAAINLTSHAHLLNLDLWMIGDASSITLMLGGTLIASSYQVITNKNKDQLFWILAIVAGIFAIGFGFLVRPSTGGISKIYATPAWVFICMGITILAFVAIVYLVDFKHKKNWFQLIKPAGTSTLTCYLVPYLLYSMLSMVNFSYPHFFNYGAGGIFRSAMVALIVIRIVALMEKSGLRLRV